MSVNVFVANIPRIPGQAAPVQEGADKPLVWIVFGFRRVYGHTLRTLIQVCATPQTAEREKEKAERLRMAESSRPEHQRFWDFDYFKVEEHAVIR